MEDVYKRQVQPNHSEAPVSEKMWIDIEVLMMEVYPSVIKVLKDAGLSPSEMHLCFLTLDVYKRQGYKYIVYCIDSSKLLDIQTMPCSCFVKNKYRMVNF